MSREPGAFRIVEHLQKLGEDIDAGSLRYHRKRVLVSKEFTFDAPIICIAMRVNARTCTATHTKWSLVSAVLPMKWALPWISGTLRTAGKQTLNLIWITVT